MELPHNHRQGGRKMKILFNITAPNVMFTEVPLDPAIPMPASGDSVVFRRNDVVWVFSVKERTISIGTDPRDGSPATSVSITVDSDPPEDWKA